MKLFYHGKDGGPDSNCEGWWVIEWKKLFSVAILRFEGVSRDAYHSHAFNSMSWVLWGGLIERQKPYRLLMHWPSFKPVVTSRETCHQVSPYGPTWVLTFRGPWAKTWTEYLPRTNEYITLSEGRVEV